MRTFTKLLCFAALLTASAAEAQYCMLPGRTPYSNNQPGITRFKLNAIDRTSLGVESMSTVVVMTNDSTTLVKGQTYTITIMDSYDAVFFPTARNNIRVWIDYNKNNSYEDNGETVISMNYHTAGTYTGTFTVPTTATVGNTMLRATVKMSDDAGHSLPTSCDNPLDSLGYHGEMEDYKVKIASPTGINKTVGVTPAINVYPNPTPGKIIISADVPAGETTSIALYDITGKQVAMLPNSQANGLQLYEFDLNEYAAASGIYFIKVSGDSFTSYQKVVKTN